MPACAACSARCPHTTVRDNGMGGVDTTLGLDELGGELWACRACGQRYRRRVEKSEPPHWFTDYDLYFFNKIEPLLPGLAPSGPARIAPAVPAMTVPPTPVYRCPECRSLDVGSNEQKSAYDMTFMECVACGHGDLVDWAGRDDWVITVQDQQDARAAFAAPASVPGGPAVSDPELLPHQQPELGCMMCAGDDAEVAWESMQHRHVRSLLQEAHLGIDLKQCFCEQHFAVVFTERRVFAAGNADQTWLAVAITDAERARLEAQAQADRPGILGACARQRRHLARSRDAPTPVWCEAGFAILPHD